MRYLTSAALADYPMTLLAAPDTQVSYIGLEEESLPDSLQNVIEAWEPIIKTEAVL
ncbi:MAG: hypothetical protein WA783_00700 [Phormidesmis sp.]